MQCLDIVSLFNSVFFSNQSALQQTIIKNQFGAPSFKGKPMGYALSSYNNTVEYS